MNGKRKKYTHYLGLGTAALVSKMQAELLIKSGDSVEKSALVDAAIVFYCKSKFPTISV